MTYFNVLADHPYGKCIQCGTARKRKSAGGKGAYMYYCPVCTNIK